jgi:hypothetical protein
VQLYVWEMGFYLLKKINIERKTQVRMVPPLKEKLVAAVLYRFFYFLFVRFNVGDIRFLMAGDSVEIAELAIGNTHIGGVKIAVDLPGDLIRIVLFDFPKLIGNKGQLGRRGLFKKKNTFLYAQKILFKRPAKKGIDCHL